MWAENSVFYQIYPLGFCGAPKENNGIQTPRILKIIDFIPHIKKLGIDAVYFSPVFESDNHGYDTRDYCKIDCRLGSNDNFAAVCKTLRQNGIRIVLDGVFNHVGRGFWAFQDVLKNRENSPYMNWFHLNFSGNSCFNDGFYYEGWEGHYELVKLNLNHSDVAAHLFSCVGKWIDDFGIDGLRLDVAYCLDVGFMKQLRRFCESKKADFFLVGEMLFGDYNRLVNNDTLHSCTNYECYKGLYSAFNDLNLFEIAHSLNRQFGEDAYALYKGKHLLSFADNHDVTRVASMIKNPKHLPLIYGVLYAMPGIPCLYYGSEWGITGKKENGSDDALRPQVGASAWNELTDFIAKLIAVRKQSKALRYGTYKNVVLTNRQLVFERKLDDEHILIAVNADDKPYTARLEGCVTVQDCMTKEHLTLNGVCELSPYSIKFFKLL